MSLHTDLFRIVKIPDLENVIMDAGNTIEQPVISKENAFTQILPILCDNDECCYEFRQQESNLLLRPSLANRTDVIIPMHICCGENAPD